MAADPTPEHRFEQDRPRTAHGASTATVPFTVLYGFHYVLRIPLPIPDDAEVGVTTSTAGEGPW